MPEGTTIKQNLGVSTGALPASRKIHVPGRRHPELRVALREIDVTPAAKEKPVPIEAQGATLLPASVTTAPKEEPEPAAPPPAKKSDELDVNAVFAKLKQLGGKNE